MHNSPPDIQRYSYGWHHYVYRDIEHITFLWWNYFDMFSLQVVYHPRKNLIKCKCTTQPCEFDRSHVHFSPIHVKLVEVGRNADYFVK